MSRKDRPAKGSDAIIYTRVSDPKQLQNTSLTNQERTCREYCEEKGYTVVRVFPEDTGRTGRNGKRPSFQDAQRFCKQSKTVGHFVVPRMNRYFRNVTQHHKVYDELLEKYGVRVESATEDCNTDSSLDKRIRAELAAAAEFESDDIGDKARAGMRDARNAGRLTNHPPMGLKREWVSRDYSVVMSDPDYAPYIKRMYKMYDAGLLLKEITSILNAEGFRTPRGKKLNTMQLKRILRNIRYAGRVPVDEETEPAIAEFEAIVDYDMFRRVQNRLDGKAKSPAPAYKRDRDEFPLRRYLQCDRCGKPFTASISTGKSGKRYAYYHCRTPGCTGKSIPAAKLHNLFRDIMQMYRVNTELMQLLRKYIDEVSKGEFDRRAMTKRRCTIELENLSKRRQKLVDLLMDQKIEHSLFEEQLEVNTNMLNDVKEELEGCPPPEELSAEADLYLSLFADLSRVWEHAPLGLRQALQRAMFRDSMKWNPNSEEIVIENYSGGLNATGQ